MMGELLSSMAGKQFDTSWELLKDFKTRSSDMMDEFEIYQNESCTASETLKFWDTFTVLVRLPRNLVRADRDGNWVLHLDTENPAQFHSI